MRDGEPLPAWLWLVPAPAIVVAQIAAKAVGHDFYRAWMRGELGIVENLTVLFLVVAIVTAIRIYRLRTRVASPRFGPFMLVFAFGCFFFAGEEASWGQHWLGFTPPEEIAARNDQGEFNLHNDPFFEKFLDQLPRNLLTAAALIGGVIGTLVRRKRGLDRFDFDSASLQGWVWPAFVCFPAALFAVTVTVPAKIIEARGDEVPYLIEISAGETKEYCLGLFLMLYVLAMHRALLRWGVQPPK